MGITELLSLWVIIQLLWIWWVCAYMCTEKWKIEKEKKEQKEDFLIMIIIWLLCPLFFFTNLENK